MNETQQEIIQNILLDSEWWFSNHAYIVAKDGTPLPAPRPNSLQKRVFSHYRKCQILGRPCLIMILKPRQKGASTIAEGVIYQHMRKFENLNGLIMGDVSATSEKVFNMFVRYAEHDTFRWKDGLPNIAQGLNFTEETTLGNGSHFSQETAGSTNAGRSGTVQVLHMDEVAFFQKASNKDPTTAVLGSFYKTGPRSLGFATSTANGASGWFYNTYQTKNEWEKIFAAWWEFDDSQLQFSCTEERDEFEAKMNQDEIDERKLYGVTLEQLKWRRSCIETDYEGDVGKFRQEMPSDPETCFLLSSRPRFHAPSVKSMKAFAESNNDHDRGNLIMQRSTKTATFIPDQEGSVQRWEQPQLGLRYLISIDTCTGEDQQLSGSTADPDYHAVHCWRAEYINKSGELMRTKLAARHKSRIDTDILAETAASMAFYYGNCLIVPEVNGMGGLHIVKLLVGYGCNVFRRKPHSATANMHSQTEKEKMEAYGWLTDKMTKKWIIDFLAPLIRNEALDIRCMEVLNEMGTFIINDWGGSEAMPGKHDDDVMATAIAQYNMGGATEYRLSRIGGIDLVRLARDPHYMAPDGFIRKAPMAR